MEGKKVAFYGKWATAIYVVALLTYVGFEWSNLLKMKPHEFGDFLAGTVGPLAFFWLVCGFYLQQEGLRQNTHVLTLQAKELEQSSEALRFQVEELRASVKQQTRMAEVAEKTMLAQLGAEEREALERERAVTPIFEPKYKRYLNALTGLAGIVEVLNVGAAVRLISFEGPSSKDKLELDQAGVRDWTPGSERRIAIHIPFDGDDLQVVIEYVRADQRRQRATITWVGEGKYVFRDPFVDIQDA